MPEETINTPTTETTETTTATTLPPVEPKKSVITEQEKEEFFKAFLADRPYQEKIPLFGGKTTLVVRTLTNKENNDILKQIAMDVEKNKGRNDDSYFMTIMTYRLALATVEVDGKPLPYSNEKEDFGAGISYVSINAKVFESWPIFKLSALQDAFRKFENKVLELTTEIQNPNFWNAAA